MKKENNKKCSLFDEMLMWTSYRYCIGRHTYVSDMAYGIAKRYYNILSDDRRQFTAEDIRREIYDHILCLPMGLHINRFYNTDEFNPIEVLFTFINEYDVKSINELFSYRDVTYSVNLKKFTEANKVVSTIADYNYFSTSDIDDLLPWEALASCFDTKNHKIIVTTDGQEIECFKVWTHKFIPIDDQPGYFRQAEFGWEEGWTSVERFLTDGEHAGTINPDYIKEIKDI